MGVLHYATRQSVQLSDKAKFDEFAKFANKRTPHCIRAMFYAELKLETTNKAQNST